MAKKLYSSTDIVDLVKSGIKELLLGKNDIITAMARDVAQELGLQIRDANHLQGTQPSIDREDKQDLETRVRAIVMTMLTDNGVSSTVEEKTPCVVHVDGRVVDMLPFPFEINRPLMDVRLQDVIKNGQGSPMGVGFMSLHKGSFPWKTTQDEVEYVIEGELHIITPKDTSIGLPGDVLFIPKDTEITFSTPSWAKFLYVTYLLPH